jgi:hypothetical protein
VLGEGVVVGVLEGVGLGAADVFDGVGFGGGVDLLGDDVASGFDSCVVARPAVMGRARGGS